MSTERNVEFKTYDGLKLRGTLFPAGDKKPLVIMTAGFGGERAQFLPDLAALFQAAGIAVLSYDNRNLGDSEGLPRLEVDPDMQVRDYFDAFNYAATLPEVDAKKIVYWGTSFAGGVVLKASALNHNIAAAIVQVPFVSGDGLPETADKVKSGTFKAILADLSAIRFLKKAERRGFKWEKRVTAQSIANATLFKPIATHKQLEAYKRALQPKKLHLFHSEDHFSVYWGEALKRNAAVQINFLKETLHL